MLRQFSLTVLLLIPTLCLGAGGFQLESELRTDFTPDGAMIFLTGHTYGANGYRIQSRIWSGSDTLTAPMSTDRISYDVNGNRTQEVLLSGPDTLAIIRYAYSGGTLQAVSTLRKDGSLRFTDILLYDGLGRKIEEQRISSAGVKMFFHRYILDAQGKTVADSLYEPVGASYETTQTVLFTYNPDLTVATESQWRQSGGGWYCVSTAFMRYGAGRLATVTTHERDGAGTGMTDSLVYAYDGLGNRTSEEEYGADRALMHRIVYVWRNMQTPVASAGGGSGRLSASRIPHHCDEIAYYDMAGRRLGRMTADRREMAPVHGRAATGLYASVSGGRTHRQMANSNRMRGGI